MSDYRVKNWRQFQHYSDRNPPWIKLHFSLLASRDWVTLDDSSRVLAVACMLIASRNEGLIPDDPGYIKRVAYLNRAPNFKPLIECGFIEHASECKQLLANARPETETQSLTETQKLTEAEGEQPARKRASALPEGFKISPEVKTWATANGFHSHLEAHLAYFVDYCKANRKLYVDHEAAFKNCIRADWGGVRKNAKGNGGTARWWESEAGTIAEAKRIGMRAKPGETVNDFRGRIRESLANQTDKV